MADIDVYNLDAGSSSKDIYDLSTSDTGTTTDESEGPTPSTDLSETDIIDLVKDILDGFDGRLVIGTESSNQAFISDANGIYLGGSNFSTAVFSVDMNGNLTASSATITGSITATTGTIGGWTVTATTLQSTNITLDSSNEVILLGSATAPLTGDGIFFGKDGAAFEFRAGSISGSKYLHYDGTNLNLVGGAISSSIITALGAGSEIAIQGWQFDGAFSATDNDTVAWATGTITLLDGTTYSITGANTGNITAVTYIYLDIAVSTTLLQTSTTASDAVGSGKILMAVAEDNSDATKNATFQVFGGSGGQGVFITADNIAANTITADEILGNTITASEIAATTITGTEISSLSISGKSITADTGTIGGWTLSAGNFSSGDVTIDATNEKFTMGTGDDILILDAADSTYRIAVGDATYADAPFSVTKEGDVLAKNIKYSPYSMVAMFQLGITGLSNPNNTMVMTGNGQYILVPGTTSWSVWDSTQPRVYNYSRARTFNRTGLTASPEVNTRVLSGTTEYIIAFADGATSGYRYDADGQNESAALTISGTTLTGTRRLAYNEASGYVYLQDGASQASTTVKRFTFSGTTLTYVDTITLDTAPTSGSCRYMWIGETHIVIAGTVTNASLVNWERFLISDGTKQSDISWGHGTSGVGFVGGMTRQDDNAMLFCSEMDNGTGTMSIIQQVFFDN